MPLITCTHCGATGNAPDHVLGTQVRCSKCKQSFTAGGEEHELTDDQEAPEEEQIEDAPADEEEEEEEVRPAKKSAKRPIEDEDEDFEAERPKSRARKSGGEGGGFGDVVMFRKLIGPGLVNIVFWLLTGISIVFGIMQIIIGSSQAHGSMSVEFILWGIVLIFFAPIVIRALCEVGVAALRSHDMLQEMKDKPKEG